MRATGVTPTGPLGETGGDERLDGAAHIEEVGDLPSGEVLDDDPLLGGNDDDVLSLE